MTTRFSRLLALATSAGLVLLAAGCINTSRINDVALKPHRVNRFDEAGSVHVAVLSASPFDRLATDLQPRFAIDENKVLEEVIPNTQLLVERVLDVVERSLRLTTPMTSTSRTTTTHAETGGANTKVTDRTETLAPGELPQEASLQEGGRTVGSLTAATPSAPNERAVDPFTKYKAAAALLQEVRLLNQYVIAQQMPKDSTAHVVRLQVTVMPYGRSQPYDVYTNVSFFPESAPEAGKKTRSLLSFEPQSAKGVALVIPLLATDNFEASSQSSAAESAQQAALSLLALVKGFGVGADYGRVLDDIRSVTGRELNALLTTSRLTNNTLRVRLGAPFSNKAGYSMVPQTYAVSAVVVVPNKTSRVDIVARSAMRDAITGASLAPRPREQLVKQACDRFIGYGQLPGNPVGNDLQIKDPDGYCAEVSEQPIVSACTGNTRAQILCLVQHVEFSRFEEFRDVLAGNNADKPQPSEINDAITALWSGVADLLAGSNYSRAWFPVEQRIRAWPAPQTVLANDDGKTVSAVLVKGRDLPSEAIAAKLQVTWKPGKSKHIRKPEELDASSVQVQDSFTSLKLIFPSPKLIEPELDVESTLTLALTNQADAPLHEWPAAGVATSRKYGVILQTKKPEPESKPSLVFSVDTVAVDGLGRAKVRLQLRDAKPKTDDGAVYLRTNGGDIVQFEPANGAARTERGLRLMDTVPITFWLENVREGNGITFILLGKDAKPELQQVRLDVWALPHPQRQAQEVDHAR